MAISKKSVVTNSAPSTSSSAARLVNQLAQLANAVARQTIAGYGPSSCVSVAWQNRDGSWRKTRLDCSQLDLDGNSVASSPNWPKWGIALDGVCYRLPMLAPHTCESGFSSWLTWPTPNSGDSIRGSQGTPDGKRGRLLPYVAGTNGLWRPPQASEADHGGPNARDRTGGAHLSAQVLWPTPAAMIPNDGEGLATWEARRLRTKERVRNGNGFGTPLTIAVQQQAASTRSTPQARDYRSPDPPNSFRQQRKVASGRGQDLNDMVALAPWPTPTHRDHRSGKASEATMARNSRPLSEVAGDLLNADFVEMLMGLPPGWTIPDGPPVPAKRNTITSPRAPSRKAKTPTASHG